MRMNEDRFRKKNKKNSPGETLSGDRGNHARWGKKAENMKSR
jgi:hypothetical protein